MDWVEILKVGGVGGVIAVAVAIVLIRDAISRQKRDRERDAANVEEKRMMLEAILHGRAPDPENGENGAPGLASVQKSVEGVSTRLQELSETVATEEAVDALGTRVERLEGKVNGHSRTLGEIETTLSSIDNRLSDRDFPECATPEAFRDHLETHHDQSHDTEA